MTKLQATMISLTLLGSFAVLCVQAQTNADQQGSSMTGQQRTLSGSSKHSPKQKRQGTAQTSSLTQQGSQPTPLEPRVRPQGNEMEEMPSVGQTQQQNSTPTTPGSEQQSKPPQTGEPQAGQEVEGMPGMQHAPGQKMKMEPLPPPTVPKLGVTQSMTKGPLVDLVDLEQMALKGNPTLLQGAAQIRSATGRKLQSGLWPNPTAGYIGEQIRGGSFGGGEQGFFVEQEFILGGKLGLNRKIFAQDVRQAEAENDEQRLRVTSAVKIQYYQALAAQEMVNMRKELLQISSETANYSRQLFNIGQQNESEVLLAEIEAQEADLAVVSAEQLRRRAMSALAAVVGNPGVQEATLGGSLEANLPELDESQLLDVLLRESPAARIAQVGVTRAEAALLCSGAS